MCPCSHSFGGSDGKASTCHCRRPGFDPWVGKIPWIREWLPTPVFLPRESHGQKNQAGYSPQNHKESDMTEQLTFFPFHTAGRVMIMNGGPVTPKPIFLTSTKCSILVWNHTLWWVIYSVMSTMIVVPAGYVKVSTGDTSLRSSVADIPGGCAWVESWRTSGSSLCTESVGGRGELWARASLRMKDAARWRMARRGTATLQVWVWWEK